MLRIGPLDTVLRRPCRAEAVAGILARMEALTLDTMRALARLQGFEWSDSELEAIRPVVEAGRRLLAELESAPVAGVDPTAQYRIL
jgi:hypothetical protein